MQAWIEVARQAAAIEVNVSDVRRRVLSRIRLERWAAGTSKLLDSKGGALLQDVTTALAAGASIAGAAESVAFQRGTAAVGELRSIQERSEAVLANISSAHERQPEQV
jgi:hypothetical protein